MNLTTILLGLLPISSPAVQGDTNGPLGILSVTMREKKSGTGLYCLFLKALISVVISMCFKKKYFLICLKHYIYIQLLKLVLKTKQSTQEKYEHSNTLKRTLSFHG